MNSPDYRMQQENEEERRARCFEALNRVKNFQHTPEDILFIASEMGLSTQYQQEIQHATQG